MVGEINKSDETQTMVAQNVKIDLGAHRAFQGERELHLTAKEFDLLRVLVREAGGAFTGLDGTAGPHAGSAVATNGLLHDAVLTALRG